MDSYLEKRQEDETYPSTGLRPRAECPPERLFVQPTSRRERDERRGRAAVEGPAEVTGRLFLGQRDPLHKPGINYLVAKYVYQAQLENCTAHTLRHTFAKNLVDAGTPLDQVATLLGHESLDTTKIYTRPGKQDLERAVRRAAGELEVEL